MDTGVRGLGGTLFFKREKKAATGMLVDQKKRNGKSDSSEHGGSMNTVNRRGDEGSLSEGGKQ